MISVITVVLNSEELLEKTILSVIDQSYSDVEYLIIDGGSSDGTVDIIKKYEKHIDYWSSSPDSGISHAFNKGLSQSSGDIIGILNAGDTFFADSFSVVSKAFKVNNIDYLYGNSVLKDINNNEIRVLKPKSTDEFPYGGMPFQHSALFVKRKVYDSVGYFNVNYRIAMDFELYLRIKKLNFKKYYLDKNLTSYHRGGLSDRYYFRGNYEALCASLSYEKVSFLRIIVKTAYQIVKTTIRKILEKI